MPVTVIVADGTVSGSVGGSTIEAPAPNRLSGQIGFFLQGADPHATIYWGTPAHPGPSTTVEGVFARLAAESAWTNVQVTATGSGHGAGSSHPIPNSQLSSYFGTWFRHPFGGLTTANPGLTIADAGAGSSFQVNADLQRARNAAGIFVVGDTPNDGMLLYFRPENRDVMWYEIRGGEWYGPLAAAPYRQFAKTPLASIQDVTRLLLGGYPFALVVIAIVLGASWLTRDRKVSISEPARSVAAWEQWSNRVGVLSAAVLTLVGFGAAVYVATALLERMPHVQDSVAYLFQAKTFALGRLWVPTPSHPDFFRHEFILMDAAGRWFSKYPPGWPAILALGVLAGAPWLVDPICAALSVFVLYRIGLEVYRRRVGLLAAALCVCAPFFIFLSGSMMSHTSGLLFTLVCTLAVIRSGRSTRPLVPALVSGVAFGILFLIRPYTALMVALPLAIYAAVSIARHSDDALRRYVPAFAGAVPFVAVFLLYNHVFTGSYFYPPQQLWWPFDQVGFGPDKGPWGFTPLDALNNTSRNLSELLEHAYGWPLFATLALMLIPFLTGRARAWDWVFLGGFVALILGYAAWWADGIMYGPRFYYEAFGFQLLLTARGIDVLLDLAQSATSQSANSRAATVSAGSIATYGIVALLVAFNAAFYLPGQLKLYQGYNYVNHSKIDAVTARGIHDAVVFADVGDTYQWWEYGMVFSANDPLLQGDVVYARDLGNEVDGLLAHDFPNRSYWRLDGTTLTPLDLTP